MKIFNEEIRLDMSFEEMVKKVEWLEEEIPFHLDNDYENGMISDIAYVGLVKCMSIYGANNVVESIIENYEILEEIKEKRGNNE